MPGHPYATDHVMAELQNVLYTLISGGGVNVEALNVEMPSVRSGVYEKNVGVTTAETCVSVTGTVVVNSMVSSRRRHVNVRLVVATASVGSNPTDVTES